MSDKSRLIGNNGDMSLYPSTTVFWQVFPLGALGAPATNPDVDTAHWTPDEKHQPGRPLSDLVDYLDYAIELGTNAILLGPTFQSFSHGYDTIDHFTVDTRIGTNDDLRTLIDAAHDKGMAIVLDGVFNHVGSDHPLFVQALHDGPGGQYADYFNIDFSGDKPTYACFEGQTGLPTLNHAHPVVKDYIVRIMNHWLDAGIDGWRLDAAYAMSPQIWQDIVPRVKRQHPHAWLMGEVIHGDYDQLVGDSKWDSITQYELWKAIWSSLNDGNFYELEWNLKRHLEFSDKATMQTFIGNHDVTRIASQLDNIADVGLAVAILMTVPGIPSIYYGDEVGFTGIKEERLGGDDAIRQPLPPVDTLRHGNTAARFWHWYSSLVSMRRQHSWMFDATIKVEHLDNTLLIYRVMHGDNQVVVALNANDKPVALDHPDMSAVAQALSQRPISAGQIDNHALSGHAYLIV